MLHRSFKRISTFVWKSVSAIDEISSRSECGGISSTRECSGGRGCRRPSGAEVQGTGARASNTAETCISFGLRQFRRPRHHLQQAWKGCGGHKWPVHEKSAELVYHCHPLRLNSPRHALVPSFYINLNVPSFSTDSHICSSRSLINANRISTKNILWDSRLP